jgi:hypothetical protein
LEKLYFIRNNISILNPTFRQGGKHGEIIQEETQQSPTKEAERVKSEVSETKSPGKGQMLHG